MSEDDEKPAIRDIDNDIKTLKDLLASNELKFDQRMKVYARLEKFYNLRLRFSGTGRGGAFK